MDFLVQIKQRLRKGTASSMLFYIHAKPTPDNEIFYQKKELIEGIKVKFDVKIIFKVHRFLMLYDKNNLSILLNLSN